MNVFQQFIAAIAPYAITGAIASVIVQTTKQWFDKSAHKLLWAILISLLLGTILQLTSLVPSNILTTIVTTLAAANTVYLVVIQWFETDKPTPQPVTPASPAAPSPPTPLP